MTSTLLSALSSTGHPQPDTPQPGSAAVAPPGSDADQHRPIRLLLVEDTDIDARLIRENLKRCSRADRILLDHVTTLAEAVAVVKAKNYDCVLLDLGLPDGRGVENVSVLREAAPGVTIVVMTGLDDEATAMEAIRRGAQEYAIKAAYSKETLARLLFHAIEREQMLRELTALRERDYQRASYDQLTGLPNRNLFFDRAHVALEQVRRSGENLSLCYLDLDGFKAVNDQYGHAVGDLLLQAVAGALQHAVRSGETVARLGGDEFIVLLKPVTSQPDTLRAVRRLIASLEAISSVDGCRVSISASVGIAVCPDHAHELDTLLKYADEAMYAAKRSGGGSYCFYGSEPNQEGDPVSEAAGATPSMRHLTADPRSN